MKKTFFILITLFLIASISISCVWASDLDVDVVSSLGSDESSDVVLDSDELSNVVLDSDELSGDVSDSGVCVSDLDEGDTEYSDISDDVLDSGDCVSASYDDDSGYLDNSVDDLSSSNDQKHHFGFWTRSGVMKSLNLTELADRGVTDILLNYFAFKTTKSEVNDIDKKDVEEFIANADEKGIKVHIWTQIFWESGVWSLPIEDGVVNYEFFDKKIKELEFIANTTGLYGINFDYLRFPGPAEFSAGVPANLAGDNIGGLEAISEFRTRAIAAIKAINPNIVISSCVAPNKENFEEWFGYNYEELSGALDLVIPMLYTGTFYKDYVWVNQLSQWFVDNSKGAEIWIGLLGYINDDNIKTVPVSEMQLECNAAFEANANGAFIFRYGLWPKINFNDLTVDEEEVKSFYFLDYRIQSSLDELNLSTDYVFSRFDDAYVEGIPIDNMIINGNNHVIDFMYKSKGFIPKSFNVTLNNIIMKNYEHIDFNDSDVSYNFSVPIDVPKIIYNNNPISVSLEYSPSLSLKLVSVKQSAKKLTISATLKKGKTPLKGKSISFIFNGHKYLAKTNEKGVARISIGKAVLKKLKVGSKVIYKASYQGSVAKRKVKVKR